MVVKGKGKGHPTTGHEGQEGSRHTALPFCLTSTLDGMCGQRHAPGVLTPKRPAIHCISGFCGLVVSMLASGTRVRGF